jgi:hypothetical protein
MFEPGVPEILSCGCTLTLRQSETVELIFLAPCTVGHQRVAQRIRGVRSHLVIKGVDHDAERPGHGG